LVNKRGLALGGDRHRMFLKSAAGRSQPHYSIGRPNRDVVQVGRDAASPRPFEAADRALIQILRCGARLFSSMPGRDS
jgi:hypothetical protein